MLTKTHFASLLLSLEAMACGPDVHSIETQGAALTADGSASAETVRLFSRLRGLGAGKLLVGHVDTNVMGIDRSGYGWWFEDGRSDVKSVLGDYPAIFGFDLVNLLAQNPPWSNDLQRILTKMREAHRMNGIVTVVWHEFNPITGGDYYSGAPVPELLPGGTHNGDLRALLDKVATLLGGLRDDDGRPIPILFRPWHEPNGSHFWWGVGRSTDEEYKRLYRFTVEYLRDQKGVHNLLYVYSPVDWYWSMDDYLARYPGDDYVDVLGLDSYGDASSSYRDRLRYYAQQMTDYAARTQKLAGFTELGFKRSEQEMGLAHNDDPHWFREVLLETLGWDTRARALSFAVFWRNEAYNPTNYYVPYPGTANERDLVDVYQDSFTSFLSDLPDMYREW